MDVRVSLEALFSGRLGGVNDAGWCDAEGWSALCGEQMTRGQKVSFWHRADVGENYPKAAVDHYPPSCSPNHAGRISGA